jgi:hypothetical protein
MSKDTIDVHYDASTGAVNSFHAVIVDDPYKCETCCYYYHGCPIGNDEEACLDYMRR